MQMEETTCALTETSNGSNGGVSDYPSVTPILSLSSIQSLFPPHLFPLQGLAAGLGNATAAVSNMSSMVEGAGARVFSLFK